ncbi:MAG: ABC transporter permease [Bacillota bacterium]
MNQVLVIAVKELKSAFRDKIFLLITALFIMLSIVSVYIGSSTKNAEMKAYQDIIYLLKSQGATNFPPSPEIYPLAILQNIIKYVSIVGAVLAVFLGFDAFSGERENGTLNLILSRPIYRDQVVTGKLLGGGCVISGILGATLVFNTVLFSLVSGIAPSISEISRLLVFILLAFLYMMLFYIATLFVSIKTGDRAFGFLAMMIVWVSVSFVIPQLADSQRSFAYALNSTSQTITQIPSDTLISKSIEIFSPTVHFQNVGKDLLQAVNETASLSILEIISRQALSLLYMVVPGIILLFAAYKAVQKEAL